MPSEFFSYLTFPHTRIKDGLMVATDDTVYLSRDDGQKRADLAASLASGTALSAQSNLLCTESYAAPDHVRHRPKVPAALIGTEMVTVPWCGSV